MTAGAAAQIGGKPVIGGNPTPGTPQPDPPKLADRITLTGCVELAGGAPGAGSAGSAGSNDGNTVLDLKYRLTAAERVDRVPPDTGGSDAASAALSRTYRLAAIDSQLSPFVGTKVEISGEVLTRPVPTVQVEFVQKLRDTCSAG
jgi:hypothetical protein